MVESFKHSFAFAHEKVLSNDGGDEEEKFLRSDFFNSDFLNKIRLQIDISSGGYHLAVNDSASGSSSSVDDDSSSSSPPFVQQANHVSVLAPHGDAVSVTSSIGSHFGSFVVSNSTGILFSNAESGDCCCSICLKYLFKVNLERCLNCQ